MRKHIFSLFCLLSTASASFADDRNASSAASLLKDDIIDISSLRAGECLVVGDEPSNPTQEFLRQVTDLREFVPFRDMGTFSAALADQMTGREICTVAQTDDQYVPAFVSAAHNRTYINIATDLPDRGFDKANPISYTAAMGILMVQENAHEATNREMCKAAIDSDNLWTFSPREAVATFLIVEAIGWAAQSADTLNVLQNYRGPVINVPMQPEILNAMLQTENTPFAGSFIAGVNAFLSTPEIANGYVEDALVDYTAAIDQIEKIDPQSKRLPVAAYAGALTTQRLVDMMVDIVDWSTIGDGRKPAVDDVLDVLSDDYINGLPEPLKEVIFDLEKRVSALQTIHNPVNENFITTCTRWTGESAGDFNARQADYWSPSS